MGSIKFLSFLNCKSNLLRQSCRYSVFEWLSLRSLQNYCILTLHNEHNFMHTSLSLSPALPSCSHCAIKHRGRGGKIVKGLKKFPVYVCLKINMSFRSLHSITVEPFTFLKSSLLCVFFFRFQILCQTIKREEKNSY